MSRKLLLLELTQGVTQFDPCRGETWILDALHRCLACQYFFFRIKCVNDKPIDPIEKVSKWQAQSKDSTTSTLNHHGASSCYGSLPTSPSPPSIADKTATTVASASGTGQPLSPPAEFDSGYPGSDRSIKFYSLKGISPALSAKSGDHQKSLSQRFLFNLQEEEKSPSAKENCDLTKSVRETPTVKYPDSDSSSSSLPSDFQPLASSEKKSDVVHVENQSKSKPSLLKPPNLHRTYLHTVTDLSSVCDIKHALLSSCDSNYL